MAGILDTPTCSFVILLNIHSKGRYRAYCNFLGIKHYLLIILIQSNPCCHFPFAILQAFTLMQQLYTANKDKQRKRKEKFQEKRNVYRAEQEKTNLKRLQKQREERKKIFRMLGKAEQRKKKTNS